MEYIAFLKSMPATTSQEESHRMTAMRKVYQKAIVTPTHHVDVLWKDYENFENSVSRALAKGLLSEYQPKFNSAKAVYRGCLMYLYHYPDIWYDYATWHAKSGSVDSAVKILNLLRYAYAELEESRGGIQPAKKIYEGLLANSTNVTSLAHIQFIRFLRGELKALKLLLKILLRCFRNKTKGSLSFNILNYLQLVAQCSGQLSDLHGYKYVAHNVFEAGLKRFMHEPGYILEYADFLCRLNDDRNVRALFERALSSLPPEESVEWLAKNLTKKVDKSILQGANSTGPEKDSSNSKASTQPTKVVYPDTSRMVIYDPRQSHVRGNEQDHLRCGHSVVHFAAESHTYWAAGKPVSLPQMPGGQEDDESTTVQSRPLPRDVFRIRQMQRTRVSVGLSSSLNHHRAGAHRVKKKKIEISTKYQIWLLSGEGNRATW
ncbi:hypothetical protein J5N97_000799 [Dioscorea zingiberensis]|uniref:Suppressor of forked domain-containing protein n=1 Tax=Dioscorea zingiberensis TaxID=325984 RepID=A0A9D5BVB6_9LILI|nr:hypothetical protein J5N97_000799 [Dioscorea zingiberensis]